MPTSNIMNENSSRLTFNKIRFAGASQLKVENYGMECLTKGIYYRRNRFIIFSNLNVFIIFSATTDFFQLVMLVNGQRSFPKKELWERRVRAPKARGEGMGLCPVPRKKINFGS